MLDTFDFVIQLTKVKLLSYILQSVTIGNLPIVPRFTLSTSGPKGKIKAILDNADLTLTKGTNQATLIFTVYAATVELTSQSQIGFSDGEIRINLLIIPGQPFKIRLTSVEFITSQTSKIADPTTFFADVAVMLTNVVDTKTDIDIFPNTPSGSAIMLLGLAINGQIFCLDADTICATIGNGDTTGVKRFLAFDDFAIGMSAQSVKNSLLYPSEVVLLDPQAVASLLGISPAVATAKIATPDVSFTNSVKPLLPAPFGSGELKQSKSDVDIFFTAIDFTLQKGSIKMTGAFYGEAFCAHVRDGVLNETITLSIVQQKVVATFNPNPPTPMYSTEFDFWCAFAFLLLGSTVHAVTGIVVVIILITVATNLTVQQNNLNQNPFAIPEFDQIMYNGIDVLPEGLVIRGKSAASVGFNITTSSVAISADTEPVDVTDEGSGTYHFPGNLACEPVDFTYEKYRQDLVVTLFPAAVGLLFPVRTTWSIHGQQIATPSGRISYAGLAYTATPPFNGTALPNHQLIIDYQLNPGSIIIFNPSGLTVLQLKIPRSNYNFALSVELRIQDASGHTYTTTQTIHAQTDIVQFGQDYIDWAKQCELAGKIKLSTIKTLPQSVLRDGDPLSSIDITNIVKEMSATNGQVAIEIVKTLSAHNVDAIFKAFEPKNISKGKIAK